MPLSLYLELATEPIPGAQSPDHTLWKERTNAYKLLIQASPPLHVCHIPSTSVLGRQEDHCEFKTSLVFRISSMLAKAVVKAKQNTTTNTK